jgi:hypothetical protein
MDIECLLDLRPRSLEGEPLIWAVFRCCIVQNGKVYRGLSDRTNIRGHPRGANHILKVARQVTLPSECVSHK